MLINAFSLFDILLQAAESLLSSLEDVIILAHSKAKVVLTQVGICICIELGWGNSGNANLMDKEPAELEVTRTAGDVRRERIILWKIDSCEIG